MVNRSILIAHLFDTHINKEFQQTRFWPIFSECARKSGNKCLIIPHSIKLFQNETPKTIFKHFALSLCYVNWIFLRFRGPILPPWFERRWRISSLLIQITIGFLSVPLGMWRSIDVDQIFTRDLGAHRMVRKQLETVPNLAFGLHCLQSRDGSCPPG